MTGAANPDLRRSKERRFNVIVAIGIIVLAIAVGLLAASLGTPRPWEELAGTGVEAPAGQGSP